MPRVSDEDLRNILWDYDRLTPYGRERTREARLAYDLNDCRTALAVVNARIAVLEAERDGEVDEEKVQRFLETFRGDGVKPEWAAKSLVPQLEQSVEKWRKRYHGTRAMHVAAQRIAATASPEPGAAHE